MVINKHFLKIIIGSIPFILIIIGWSAISFFNFVPNWLLPSPINTFRTFFLLIVDKTIPSLILVSAINALPALAAAFISAVILGLAIGSSNTIRKMFLPFMSAVYPIPSLAWLPLIIIFVGFTRWAIWIVVFMAVFIRVIYVIVDGVRSIDKHFIMVARNFGYTHLEVLFKVVLPASLPAVITGARLGFGSAWRSLIGAEMLVVSLGGLGKFIWFSQWYYSFDKVFAGILTISIIGIIIEQLILRTLEKKTLELWGVHDVIYKP